MGDPFGVVAYANQACEVKQVSFTYLVTLSHP